MVVVVVVVVCACVCVRVWYRHAPSGHRARGSHRARTRHCTVHSSDLTTAHTVPALPLHSVHSSHWGACTVCAAGISASSDGNFWLCLIVPGSPLPKLIGPHQGLTQCTHSHCILCTLLTVVCALCGLQVRAAWHVLH